MLSFSCHWKIRSLPFFLLPVRRSLPVFIYDVRVVSCLLPVTVAVPGFEEYITIDLEDITTYENPPWSVLDLNEISVATSSVFVAEFEKMLRRKQWMRREPGFGESRTTCDSCS
jgi:hypothetical protein